MTNRKGIFHKVALDLSPQGLRETICYLDFKHTWNSASELEGKSLKKSLLNIHGWRPAWVVWGGAVKMHSSHLNRGC